MDKYINWNKKVILIVIFLSLLLFIISDLAIGEPVAARPITQRASWYWAWRQPPYIIVYDWLGYPWVFPHSEIVTQGGENNDILYSETMDDENLSPYPKGLYRSNDKGVNWEHLAFSFDNNDIQTLKFHPTNPNIILAGTYNSSAPGGMYRSSDSGDTWENVLAGRIIYDIEVDPLNPNIIYTSTCCWGGIYKSEDYGLTWNQISDQFIQDLQSHPVSPNVLFGARYISTNPEEGIYRSDDGGETWTQIANLGGQPKIIIDTDSPSQMFAFGRDYGGVWRTDDNGETWTDLSSRLPHIIADPTVYSAAIDPNDDSIWIGLKYDGMLVSYDHGDTWTETNNGIPFYGGGIFGPQCTSITVLSDDTIAINCEGRIYVRISAKTSFLPLITN
jgi:photosystem II stability/assembly factor-like uncharacterized protein